MWRETYFLLMKKEYTEEGQKMQVSFYLVHYWITAAESYFLPYLELDSRWFAYSASGCLMGARAFIFLSPYSLNEDPYCFPFSKPHPQSNKLSHWREKNTPRQGNTTSPHRGMWGREKCHHCTCWDPKQSKCTILFSISLALVLSKSLMNLVWPSLTVLDLISSSGESSWDVGSAEFQFLANTFILKIFSSLMK